MIEMSSAQSTLPPIPQPPHDPTWWLLDGRVGWRGALLEKVEVTPACCTLSLRPVPGSGRSPLEPSGSFGGVTLPSNMAFGPDGQLYLLDAGSAELKRFDSCECAWKTVPCFGGRGAGARQLDGAHGIGVCSGNLFVCDTGNRRLAVYTLHGFALRGFWSPPAAADLANVWEPYAVAFDGRGRVFVSDGANGCVHRFAPHGRWEMCLPGFGKVTHLAADCRDRLYAVVEGEDAVRVFDAEGTSPGVVSRVDEMAAHFPRLPFLVDAQGNLHLGELCPAAHAPACGGTQPTARGVFDLAGRPAAAPPPAPAGPVYEKEGTYLSEALDSALYKCQWHRVVLGGRLPAGARLRVSTYTAEATLTTDQLLDLPEDAWQTKQLAQRFDAGGAWDCLVGSGEGRYLWLKLDFKGNGAASPVLDCARVEFPRVSLRRYLPAVFGEDPGGASFTDRFLSIFDTTLRGVEREVDEQARLFDPLSTPAEIDPRTGVDFLSWLASWVGLTLDRQWPEAKRRNLLKHAARLYHLRGTREGLWRQLLLHLGMEPEAKCCPGDGPQNACRPADHNCAPVEEKSCAWQPPPLILEHYQLRRWLFVGAGRLGAQAVLWGKRVVGRSQLDAGAQVSGTKLHTTQDPYRDPFHVYAHKFSVFVPACYEKSDRLRRALENLLEGERPAHTQAQLVFVEPRFRIGFQSMIGFDSVVGRYPEGVTLGGTPLGRASVLTAAPDKQGAPSFDVGVRARVGTTTKLD